MQSRISLRTGFCSGDDGMSGTVVAQPDVFVPLQERAGKAFQFDQPNNRVCTPAVSYRARAQRGSAPVPNRKLTPVEIEQAVKLLHSIRKRLDQISAGDPELLFALRRRLVVKLTHDERGTAAQRNKIKRLKRAEQNDLCPICSKKLPLKYAELDRFSASAGYTMENTRLVHHDCHIKDQKQKAYL